MKITVILEQSDYDALHDIVYNATGVSASKSQLKAIWDMLPINLQEEAMHWGLSDTVVRDNTYEYIHNRFKEEKKILKNGR